MSSSASATRRFRHTPDPRLLLDVALVRLTNPKADTSIEALTSRVDRLERDRGGPTDAGPPAKAAAIAEPVTEAPAAAEVAGAPPARASRPPARAATGKGSMPARPDAPPRPAVPAAPIETAAPEPAPEAAVAPATEPAGDLPAREISSRWPGATTSSLSCGAWLAPCHSPGRFVESDGEAAVFALPANHPLHRCEPLRPEVEAAPGRLQVFPGAGPAAPGHRRRPGGKYAELGLGPSEHLDPADMEGAPAADVVATEQLAQAFPSRR